MSRFHLLAALVAALALLGACTAGEPAAPVAPRATPGEQELLAFEAETLDGAVLDARTLRGEALALWFWAPW